jgi:D-arabinonate dehydratase/D-galactarolactone cycloisomerase
MKIKTIESFIVRVPYTQGNWGAGFWSDNPKAHPGLRASHPGDITTEYPPIWRNRAVYPAGNETVVVRIETDSGIVGWGEAHTPVSGEISKQVIDTLLAPLVMHYNPLDIHPIWEAMYSSMRLRGHSSGYLLEAMSGIDIALWDIAGKHLNAPISKLLGGQVRHRIPVYASSLPRLHAESGDAGLAALVDGGKTLVERGYRAFKVKLGIDIERDREALLVLREAVGPDIGIAVDVGAAYDLAFARRAGERFNDANILWLEEPLMPENMRDYAQLTEFLDVAVAGGECLCNRWAFNDYLAAKAFDIIQPDVARAGGISECRRISMIADVYGVSFAPHLSTGTAIYMAASLQWAAAGANLMTCEWPLDQEAAGDGILNTPFQFEDGYIVLSGGPGLGIDINEAALRRWQV